MNRTYQLVKAFTLIELSIVLVIIGLVVGGALVGRDLIAASQVRAQISQIEKNQQAVNTFKGKYGYLPGDILPTEAAAFGLYSTQAVGFGSAAIGNGDSFVRPSNANPISNSQLKGEVLIFWRHLSDAGLIDGNCAQNLASGGAVPSAQGATQNNLWIPDAKIGRGSLAAVSSDVSNFFQSFAPATGIAANGNYAGTLNLTPQEAFAIDAKIDDGLPISGNVVAMYDGWLIKAVTAPNSGSACPSPWGNYYENRSGYSNLVVCSLGFKFQ